MTPEVRYRRAWSMAVFQGRLFVGTLPGGRVLSIEAGRNATYDTAIKPGWRHIAACRDKHCLKLYVDGKPVASSSTFDAADYDLSNVEPLKNRLRLPRLLQWSDEKPTTLSSCVV